MRIAERGVDVLVAEPLLDIEQVRAALHEPRGASVPRGVDREVSVTREAEAVAHYAKNIETILKTLTDTGAVVFIALLDDQSNRPWFHVFSDNGLNDEALARQSRNVVGFNAAIRDLAARYHATTVDFTTTTVFTDPTTVFEDGLHPNAVGYDIVAGVWWDALRARL